MTPFRTAEETPSERTGPGSASQETFERGSRTGRAWCADCTHRRGCRLSSGGQIPGQNWESLGSYDWMRH